MSCPYCKSRRVYRSSNVFIHSLRTLLDSKKRYCGECKKRWQSRFTNDLTSRIFSSVLLLILFFGILAAIRVMDKHNVFDRSFSRRSSTSSGAQLSEAEILNQKIKAGEMMRRAQKIERLQKQIDR